MKKAVILRSLILFVLLALILSVGCQQQPAPEPTPTPPPVPQEPAPTPEPEPTPEPTPPLPKFESAECQFEIPHGQTVECGYLTVPKDRSQPDGSTIRLHIAIFRSHSDQPAPDPVVYLAGGPGVRTRLSQCRLSSTSVSLPSWRTAT